MFDSLLGRKFSAKCKHSIKRIISRVHLVRKKKQAMLNFLKKDVADLLSNGHQTNAFDRMEGLMSQMEHIRCYDMIETYCQFILSELSTLQKQRECPAEYMEAITTLIFAAARFSDLPELCDLRRVFTARFANSMGQQSVNPEFVEKLSAKAFPKDRKLKLMQDIAQEFSVEWDSKDFGLKKHDRAARVVDAAATARDGNGKVDPSLSERPLSPVKAAAIAAVARHQNSSSPGGPDFTAPSYMIKNSVLEHEVRHSEASKDIHVVLVESSAIKEFPSVHPKIQIQRRAALLDEPENVEPENFDAIISPISKSQVKSASLAPFDVDGLTGRELKPSIEKLIHIPAPPYVRLAFPPEDEEDKPVERREDKPLINRAPPYVIRSRATTIEKADRINDERPEPASADEDTKPKPRSVRKHRRPQEGALHGNNAGRGIQPSAVAPNEQQLVERYTADREGRPRQGSCTAVEHSRDEEETALGMISRRGQDDRCPKKSDDDGSRIISSQQTIKGEAVNISPPARAASVLPTTKPPSPNEDEEEMKGPAPAMQPAAGGRVHPRLPDYDELAARFNALKKR